MPLTFDQIAKRAETNRLAVIQEAYFDSVVKVADSTTALHYPPHPDDPPKREWTRRCEACVGDAVPPDELYEYPVTSVVKLLLCLECYEELTDLH